MSATARYYLEQSLVELEDLHEQGLFEKSELNIIMRRRTDFEHRIASRATRARDFVRYAAYEASVERLRQKRVARLGHGESKGVSSYAGPRRVFFIYERGTRRFPGEIGMLWVPYLRYAAAQGAARVLGTAYTRLLAQHPADARVWVMAAKQELEGRGAVRSARAILQRGLRLNPGKEELWLEYIRLELVYVAQLVARQKVGRVLEDVDADGEEGDEKIKLGTLSAEVEASVAKEMAMLPDIDVDVLGESNPVLRGEIAMLVFESALSALGKARGVGVLTKFAEKVLQVVKDFVDLDRESLGERIVAGVAEAVGETARTRFWETVLPVYFKGCDDVDAVGEMVRRYQARRKLGDQATRIEYGEYVHEYLRESSLPTDPNLMLLVNSVMNDNIK